MPNSIERFDLKKSVALLLWRLNHGREERAPQGRAGRIVSASVDRARDEPSALRTPRGLSYLAVAATALFVNRIHRPLPRAHTKT